MIKVVEYAKLKNTATRDPNTFRIFWRNFYEDWANLWPTPALMDVVKREESEESQVPPEDSDDNAHNGEDDGEGVQDRSLALVPKLGRKSRGPMTMKTVSMIHLHVVLKNTYTDTEAQRLCE